MASITDGIVDLAGDAVGSVKRGAGVALREVARVAKEHGVSADAVKSYGDQLVNENPQQATSFAEAPGTSAVEGIAGSLPALGAHLAGAATGARIGRSVGGGRGAVVGGILGGLAPDFVQAYGGNLERQDETGQHDAGSAALAAVGQAALNQINPIPAARALRIPGVPASIANVDRPLVDAATHALGFGVAGAATAPAQEALTRAAAGQSLSDPDALNAYKEAAIQGGIAGGVVGGVSRATENVLEAQRQRARDAEQRNADLKAGQQEGKPKKPEPEPVPFSPPDLNELSPAERIRLDRAINPAPIEVDPAKGPTSKALARGAADGVVEGVTEKPKPLPVLGEPDVALAREVPPAKDAVPVYQSDRFTGPDEQPLTIEGKKGLKPDQREVEQRSVKQVLDDPEAALSGYAALPDTDGGRIINADDARELFPDYNANAAGRTRHAASVQAAASWVADRAWERALAAEPRPGSSPDVVFMAGGSGAGKGTARKAPGAEEANKAFNAADIVFDGTFKDFNKSRNYIEQALSSGRTATIVYVSRDPVQAFLNGVLTRASREDYGRAVPIDVHLASHQGAANTVAELAKLYQGDDRVNFHVIHNGEEIKLGTVDDIANRKQISDNELVKEISNGIEAARAKGTVPDRVYSYYRDALEEYRASEGARSGEGIPQAGGADGREPTKGPQVARATAPAEATLDTVKTGEPVIAPNKEVSNGNDRYPEAAGGAIPAAAGDGLRQQGRVRGSAGGVEEQGRKAIAPVAGLPEKLTVAGRPIKAGPFEPAHAAARDYAARAGVPYRRPAKYVKVDEARAKRIAQAFEEMKHAPDDPEVRAAYAKMIEETQAQWEAIKRTGLKVEFIKPGQPDPYARSPRLMTEDVRDNNHMWVFPTDAGFGGESSQHVDVSGNPLNVKTGETIDGKQVVANDIFRIVHDYFGHVKEGYGFRADGEENAYQSHALMYSDLARRALATETRGQNSWVNYGPYGEKNRTANGVDTEYAPQKIGLLPEWVTNDHIGYEGEEGAGSGATATERALAAASAAAGHGAVRASLGRDERRAGRSRGEEARDQLGPDWAPLPRLSESVPSFTAGKRQPDAVSAVAVHYSTRAGLTALDPTYAGSGSAGQERRRFGAGQFGKNGGTSARTYFYVQDGHSIPAKEDAVAGSNVYRTRLDNLYDAVNDPRGYREEAGMNADYFEELVMDGGFDGFMAPAPGGGIDSPVAITFGFKKRIPVVPIRDGNIRGSVDESKPYKGRGMPARTVSDLVSRQTRNWKSGPAIEVVPSHEFLPESIRSVLPKRADGAYDGSGKIYLVADRLNSARDVRRVIAHEAYAHYGVKGVLGDKFDEFFQRVQNLKDTDEDIRRAYASVEERYQGLEPQELADEVVAHLAENYSTLKGRAKIVLAQVISSIKRFLARTLNIQQDWSVNDVLSMIARSKRAIEQSPAQAARTAAAARASLTADPFYSALTRSVVAAKGAPKSATAQAWRQWLDGAQRRGEFKQSEREWLGLDAWLESQKGNVSRADIENFVKKNGVKLDETILGGDPSPEQMQRIIEARRSFEESERRGENAAIWRANNPHHVEALRAEQDNGEDAKFGRYTLPGGENYREVLMQLPIDREAYAKSLVDPAVWDRMSQEQRAEFSSGPIRGDGNTTYKSSHFDQPNIIAHLRLNDRTGPNGEKILHIEEIQSDWHQEGRKKGYGPSIEYDVISIDRNSGRSGVHATYSDRARAEAHAANMNGDVVERMFRKGVPDAPFKKEWPMLAFKRALREAVENGYDRVTFTTGEQQAARYDLSKQIKRVVYHEKPGRLTAEGIDGGSVIDKSGIKPEDLPDYIGKEAADKLINAKPNNVGVRQLEGDELRVGGEGMKAFYDKMLPSEINKYVKQWGSKVEPFKITVPESRIRFEDRNKTAEERGVYPAIHSVPITDAMRESVRAGQPMFSIPTQAESFDGWTRPSERLSDYITNSAKERIEAYRKVATEKGNQLRGLFQDYFNPVKRVQQAIIERGGTISDDSDVYGREELYYGRTGERLRKLEDDHVKPIMQEMAKTGTSLDDLELYLYAKFAPERNARIAAINERMPDGGSGMTNADAEKVLKDFEASGQAAKLEALAKRVYAMNEVRVAALEDAGLIGKDEAAAWREDKHYVPLKGFAEGVADDKVQRPPIGSGFSVGGKEAWRALGRRSRATDILANIVAQTDQAIIRAEKNRVAQALLKLVQDNPNDKLWTVDKTVNKPGFDRATGEVKYSNRPEPDAVIAKVNGEEHRINIYDPQLRDAIKNMGAAKVGAILRGFSSINRFLSLTRTTLAPEFALANFSRDIQEASVNLTGKLGPGVAARAVADVPSAIKAMWGQLGGKKVGGEWARWAQEFADEGGMTSFVAQRTVEEAQSRLEGLLREANGGAIGNARKLIRGAGDFIEQANNTIENATRLSAYVQARRAGMSTEQAARLAKNLTVNFNRKGSAGTAINALWLFYNASIQGSARFLHAIKSPRVQAMMGAIAAAGYGLSYYNRVVAGKDDDGEDLWDKVPDYEKQRNLIVMNAFGQGTRLKIPMPYTYNLPFLLGAEMADMVHGKKPPSTAAANMVNSIVGSFNPIGDYDIKKDPTEQTVKLFSPTALQPFLDLAFNRNHFDAPITPEESPFSKVKAPDSQRYFPTTNPGAVWLADQLNTLTGGNKVRPGAIDISPASMVYLMDYLTGGTGTFFERTATAAALLRKGEDVPIGKVPFVRVFAGSLDDRRINDTFYQARDDVNAKAEIGKLIAKPNGFPDASPADHKDARFGLALAAPLRDIERRLKPINEAIKLARAKGDDAKLKKLQADQRTLMLQFNRAYYRVKEQMQD